MMLIMYLQLQNQATIRRVAGTPIYVCRLVLACMPRRIALATSQNEHTATLFCSPEFCFAPLRWRLYSKRIVRARSSAIVSAAVRVINHSICPGQRNADLIREPPSCRILGLDRHTIARRWRCPLLAVSELGLECRNRS